MKSHQCLTIKFILSTIHQSQGSDSVGREAHLGCLKPSRGLTSLNKNRVMKHKVLTSSLGLETTKLPLQKEALQRVDG